MQPVKIYYTSYSQIKWTKDLIFLFKQSHEGSGVLLSRLLYLHLYLCLLLVLGL